MSNFFFILNNEKIPIPKDIKVIKRFPDDISNILIQYHEYQIQAKVQIEILQGFLDYLFNGKIPILTVNNIYQYNLLNEELKILNDILNQQENIYLFKISVIRNVSIDENSDKSNSERFISQNLDFFLTNYSNEMKQIPINSLYNIFNHKERVLNDTELAYHFIINGGETNKSLYILLQSLDGTKLTKKSINESFSQIDEHCGFFPRADFSFIERCNAKKINLLIITVEKQQTIDFVFIDILNKQNSKYKIKLTQIFDHVLYDILNKTFFLSQFDIIAFGGCDSFSNYTCNITLEQAQIFIQYHNCGGIILFMHNFFFSKYINQFSIFANLLGYEKQDEVKMFNNVKFNEASKKNDVISFPFNVGNTIKVANTHQTPKYDPKYTVLYNGTVNTHYYSENLDQNIADIEMGHTLEITDDEKKVFYNIICHLFEKRNLNVDLLKDPFYKKVIKTIKDTL